jgi:hypothetical protein
VKILVIGANRVYAIENFYVRYMRESGLEVEHFPAQEYFYNYYYKNIVNKILYRVGISATLNLINKQLLKKVNSFLPDIVWIFKGMEIFPETIQKIKKMGCITVNYNPDNPFIFSGKGSGNKFITESIGLYDLHFTYNLEIKRELEVNYNARTFLLPFAFDLDNDLYELCQQQEEVLKLCFLGNPDKGRAFFLQNIASKGVKIDVYGNNWSEYIQDQNIQLFEPVYGNDLWKTLRAYRVQLNLMRVHNENSHNMRTFEVPGVAGILLAKDTVEHRMFFKKDKEIFLFDDAFSCVAQVNRLLALNNEDAEYIRASARKKCEEKGYSYKDRTNEVIKIFREFYV